MTGLTSDEIRETYLSFFEQRGHMRRASGSLVPADYDPSVLLTTAGMHPLKPYFLGQERPPHNRLTSCQKCFRTTDIENVGNTARHLTFFEMLGNFSLGDYFKQGAVEQAWQLSLDGFGFKAGDIWITVFEGDRELGLGPDEEAIAAWESVGVPRERIVLCPRSENFWQAGPTGPCGPCSELYLDRGVEFGSPEDLPGGENERFLEYWNLVFMQFNQDPIGTLTPLPNQNIDTGLGLNRMALIQQDAPTIFETDQFAPLMALGRELSPHAEPEERALRILADHSRAMTFLIADGVVPSNEDRGYILRRVMRRAIQQGHHIGIEPGFMPRFVDVVVDVMGAAYPELVAERDLVNRWVKAEEEGFGRTLEQGTKLLEEVIQRSREDGSIPAEDAFRLHDTFGFPFEVTRELALEQGLEVDTEGFDSLMEQQRARARAGGRAGSSLSSDLRARATDLAKTSAQTDFTGYEALEQRTTVGVVEADGPSMIVKLAESPFYATGGGQVADGGTIECEDGDCRAQVVDVLRLGDDQAVVVELDRGRAEAGGAGRGPRGSRARATRPPRTTRRRTSCTRRCVRAWARMSARRAPTWGRTSCASTSRTARGSTDEDVRAVEDQVNAWITGNDPVRPIVTTLDEAKALGATALFGEKYGDVVRMVEIGDGSWSRELCGGTHVRSTAEIGLLKVTSEGSSAANVRRIEAITGPEAVAHARTHDALLHEAARALRTQPDRVPEAIEALQQRAKQAAKASAGGGLDVADARLARRGAGRRPRRDPVGRHQRRQGARRRGGQDQGPARRRGRGRARHDGRRTRAPRRGGDARPGRRAA